MELAIKGFVMKHPRVQCVFCHLKSILWSKHAQVAEDISTWEFGILVPIPTVSRQESPLEAINTAGKAAPAPLQRWSRAI